MTKQSGRMMNMQQAMEIPKKVVRKIPAKVDIAEEIKQAHRQLRVAAYCRVSTAQEEQLNSYDVQVRYYTEKIRSEPKWAFVGIFADRGLSGTSTKKRDEFNKMIKMCRRGKIDMIITKSISRFARNTADVLKYVRMLKEIGVDIFFEEQNIHSTQPGAEFYITIYGSIAQSESENISANVIWGKNQSAKEGKVPFQYKRFLGYRRGTDGKPEIDPEQAEVVKRIYASFLAGDSMTTIANSLTADGIPTPTGSGRWVPGTIQSIISNEKYAGNAVLNKTYVVDCLSKKVKRNDGKARPMYFVENNHPAIIDSATFGRAQEELARRTGKRKVKQKGTKTEQGRYSSKYALTELLVCGECGTPYRRCTWTIKGEKKPIWRCINRLDFGKKYCHHSPTMEESVLQEAIMTAILRTAKQSADVLGTLKLHIGMGLEASDTEDNSLDIQVRIAEIDAEFKAMLQAIATDTVEDFDEQRATELMAEKSKLEQQLTRYGNAQQEKENAKSRLDEIFTILEGLENHPMEYDDRLVRQVLECVVVESKEKIKVIFAGGLEVEQAIENV
ncbi:recombinase family protein [Neglecta sp. X4]|nr:recombinase family protein [Neglectibacter sp. 59]NBJ73026.1 recombinase family protein [Neglectibacter sp. X4]NCE80913.1 recombinase family protein [Neglectibacter sp. X58]